jgi:tripeptide aminopeptidase
MLNVFTEVAKENGADFSHKEELSYKAFMIDEKEPVCNVLKKAGDSLGLEIKFEPTGGGLDANVFNERGIPCVALGLGNDKPHMKEEYVSIKEMKKCVEFLKIVLEKSVE